MAIRIKFQQWHWFSVGLVALSAATVMLYATNAISSPPSQKQSTELPNCDNPADQFEESFCQIQPNCDEPMSQMEMNYCSAWAAKLSDRQLNQVYQQVQVEYRRYSDASYQALRLNKLTEAQLAWIKYRDTNCEWQTSKYDGGSIQPLINHGCVERMTKQRTQELLDSLEP